MSIGELLLVFSGSLVGVVVSWRADQLQKAAELRAIRERSGSKVKAADRLRSAIAADRAAVPCGRWVRCRSVAAVKWKTRAEHVVSTQAPPTGKDFMPRYRYEVRR